MLPTLDLDNYVITNMYYVEYPSCICHTWFEIFAQTFQWWISDASKDSLVLLNYVIKRAIGVAALVFLLWDIILF